MRKKKQFLGELLVSKGYITHSQLNAVIEDQMRNKKFLGVMLVERGLIDEEDLLRALAEQFDIECAYLNNDDIDWDLAIGFSSNLIADHKCLPIQADDDTLTLAITNPLDAWVMDKAEHEVAPKKLKIILTTISCMDVAIKEYRKRSIRKMMNKWKKD